MKRVINIISCLLVIVALPFSLTGQSNWDVPTEDSKKLSFRIFDDDIILEGSQIYNTSCASCHGNPAKNDFVPMAPPPGDVASQQFQQQSDGELFYKVKIGRGSMPAFENSLGKDEIWSIVAYIRSFHLGYQQQLPNMDGVIIPKLAISTGYDDNVDKLVVKVIDEDSTSLAQVSVKAYLKGMFGNHYLGNASTNQQGIAYIDVDSQIPGDEEGYVDIIIKASMGFASEKTTERIRAGTPTVKVSAIEGRHLWSRAAKAPIWMIITFNLIGIGIWGIIFYIVIGLRKIRKLQ